MNIFNKGKLTNWSNLQMKADKKTAELNISGYIGVPEWWQFDPDMEKELISTKEKMQQELKEISNLKVDNIIVNIDSLGGDVNHGQAMYSALKKNPASIKVVYTGWSASIATIIAAAATDNDIEMSPTNMILIHKSRTCMCGTANAMRKSGDFLDKIDNTMAGVYSEQSGNSKESMLELMSVNDGEGEWLTASEALEHNLIGGITEELRAAASFDETEMTKKLARFGYNIPQNKLNTIKMNFGKKDKPINALAMQDDSILLHEGELKEGVELKTVGENANIEAGVYEAKDGRKITIDADSKVTLIEAKVEETPKVEGDNSEVINAVAEMIAELETKFEAKLEVLRKTGSKAKVEKITPKDHNEIAGSQMAAKAGIQARLKTIQEDKRKKQEE